MKKKSNKKMGLEFETTVARMLTKYTNYTVESKTIGSGCFWHSKGDLIISQNQREYVVEIKGTNKDSYRLSAKQIAKIWDEALESCKLGMFAVLIEGKRERKLCIIEIGLYCADNIAGKVSKTILINSKLLEGIKNGGTLMIQNDKKLWHLSCTLVEEDK